MSVAGAEGKALARVDALDSIRGLGALAVVLFHLDGVGKVEIPTALSFIRTHFGLGVQVFFVLSAFSLFWTNDRRRHEEADFTHRFLVRRAARLTPLFYAMMLFWVVARRLEWGLSTSPTELLLNATFTYNLVPGYHESIVWAGWTLGVETIFYASLPVLFHLVYRMQHALLVLVLSVVVGHAAGVGFDENPGLPPGYSYFSFLTQFPAFAAGIAGFYAIGAIRALDERGRRVLVYGTVLALPCLWLTLTWHPLTLSEAAYVAIWSVAFAALIAVHSVATTRIVTNRFTRFLGRVSYSLYLFHPFAIYKLQPVYRSIEELLGSASYGSLLACTLVTLAVLLPLSELGYRAIEQPGIALGRRLLASSAGRTGLG